MSIGSSSCGLTDARRQACGKRLGLCLLGALLMPGCRNPSGGIEVAAPPRHAGSHLLRNGRLAVEVMEPNHPERYNRGVRFTPVAAVLAARFEGRDYLYNPVAHDPVGDHGGLAAEFDLCIPEGPADHFPPGYAEAEVGGGFLKIGVGVLRKQVRPYSLFQNCEVIAPAETTVDWRPQGAAYRQTCPAVNGYAYALEADLQVGTDRIAVTWTLRNTGTKPFTTRHYSHNFLRFGDQDVGPGYGLAFPYDFTATGLEPEQEQRGRTIHFRKRIPTWVNAVVPFPADFTGTNVCEVRSDASGQWLRCETSLPGLRTDIHARAGYLSPEQFVAVGLAPGEFRSWHRTYVFGLRR